MKKALLSSLLTAALLPYATSLSAADRAFIEAESFSQHGGWVLDTQFIMNMGSPYLMAHGLGKTVAPAVTTVDKELTGKVKIWVRTKNWVGAWDEKNAPGQFQLAINGKKLETIFGTTGKDWHWQAGPVVELDGKPFELSLHDLTGFNGRVDAIYFSKDLDTAPPDDGEKLSQFRHEALGLPEVAPKSQEYDLVVVGGGYSGLGSAISAARQGLKVALIQDRPVLGGNGSSEVQVWAMGGTRRGIYPRLGEIIDEFNDNASNSPGFREEYGDDLKELIVRREKNIDLFLNHSVWKVVMEKGRKDKIAGAVALNTRTGEETQFVGKLFVDCTGHGTLGALANASFTMLEKGHLGMSNMWVVGKTTQEAKWPETPWSLQLELDDFPHPRPLKAEKTNVPERIVPNYTPPKLPEVNRAETLHGEWFWESGFDKHPIDDLEKVRDWNLRAVFGAFSSLKKNEADKYKDYEFKWVAYIGGPRESRLLEGDIVLTEEDMVSKKEFPDGCVPTTWDLDLHYPREQYMKKYPENPFISRAEFGEGVDRNQGYPVPYRCFYSKDIENLFMAGRNISVTHGALGSTRVMRTCGMMGEVVGKAAFISIAKNTTPRGVYEKHLEELKTLMHQPGAMRRDSLEGQLYLPDDAVKLGDPMHDFIQLSKIPGIVVDDAKATLTGNWTHGRGLKPYVADGYAYASGDATATFPALIKEEGTYEVRINYQPHENRSKTANVVVATSEGEKEFQVDQTQKAEHANGFHSLGEFKFKAGEEVNIIFTATTGKGHTHIDSVQILKK